MKSLMKVFIAFAMVMIVAGSAWATNGMETTATGSRAAGMGGVDLGIATDTTAINTNPAGLTQLLGHRIDFGAGLLIPSLHFKNDLNDEDGATQVFPLPVLSYAYRFQSVPLATGIGFFAQGGMGADFELENPILGKDIEYSSNIALMRISPAIAYQPHPMISIGASVNVAYSQLRFKMPYAVSTSMLKGVADPSSGMTFGDMFGTGTNGLGYDELVAYTELDQVSAWGFGGKIGLLFKPHDMISIGLAYTTKTQFTFDGTVKMFMEDQFNDAFARMVQGAMQQGLPADQAEAAVMQQLGQLGIDPTQGVQTEYDAEIKFAWPQKAGLGIGLTPTEDLLFGLDVTWINWADTMDEFKMTLTNSDNPNINRLIGDDEIEAALPLDWEDQIVVAVGGQYQIIPNLWGRLGYNFGKNPVPDDTVFPIFPAIVEHHATAGVGYRYKFFEVNAAYEQAFSKTMEAADNHKVGNEYDGSESTLGESTVHLMTSFMF